MLEPAEGHEHELLAKGEVFQQQLITAERAVTLGPQAILISEALGRKMALHRMAFLLPRQAYVHRLSVQGQRLVQGTGQRCIGIQIQRQATEVDLTPVSQRATGKTQAEPRTTV
ncbi:hypothetical protein D3C76_739860 [compost metagenome]